MNFSYGEGWFPFPIPETAEDGAPFEVWDGSTLYNRVDYSIPSSSEGDTYTGYSYTGSPSKSETQYVTTVGPLSPYPIGPFTLEQLSELYWRVRDWSFTLEVTGGLSAGGVSLSDPITGTFHSVIYDGSSSTAIDPLALVDGYSAPDRYGLGWQIDQDSTGSSASASGGGGYVSFQTASSLGTSYFLNPPWVGFLQHEEIYGVDDDRVQGAPVVCQISGTARNYWMGLPIFLQQNLFSCTQSTGDGSMGTTSFITAASVITDPTESMNWTSILETLTAEDSGTHVSYAKTAYYPQTNTISIVLSSGTVTGTFATQISGASSTFNNLGMPDDPVINPLSLTMTGLYWYDYDFTYYTDNGLPI